MKLRDQQEEVNSLKGYSKREISDLKEQMHLAYEEQLKRITEMIDRSEPSDLNLSEDPVVYSSQEIKNLLQRIAEGNRATGGLNFVTKVYGCIKFLESYYLILVTKRRQIGCVCGHAIYSIFLATKQS
ncbi:hypothetical protein CsatB_014310 [Cannabis sativa]